MMGVVEILRATTEPGDGVVIMPPVYPPFAICTAEAGCVTVPVPLRDTGSAWEIDLDGIEAALAGRRAGCAAVQSAQPDRHGAFADALAALAEIAERHGAVVISDEIHAPLVARA
jgi:cystathionine beta-lyase